MVKNIDLEAPKSPHPKLYFLFLLLKKFFTSRSFRALMTSTFKFLLLVKKYRDKLCLGTFDFTIGRLMQVYKPYSCVLRRK